MAELNTDCCTAETQASCCEPQTRPTAAATARLRLRRRRRVANRGDPRDGPQRYATPRAADGAAASCGCEPASPSPTSTAPRSSAPPSTTTRRPTAARAAIDASLGCGVPTAVADLHDGETVLDLGSGAGADVLISARRVGPTGKAIGLDMTDEMLDLARANAAAGRRRRTSSSSRATSRTCRSPTRASTS